MRKLFVRSEIQIRILITI